MVSVSGNSLFRAAGVYGHTYGLHKGYPWAAGWVSVELVRDELLQNNLKQNRYYENVWFS